jgi:gamma-glutamyltranspeptidase
MDFFGLIPNAGAAAAWVDSVEAFGSGKLSMAEILKPSISLAEEGYKLSLLSSSQTGVANHACLSTTGFLYRKSTALRFGSSPDSVPDKHC